jgi:hypothetical protein
MSPDSRACLIPWLLSIMTPAGIYAATDRFLGTQVRRPPMTGCPGISISAFSGSSLTIEARRIPFTDFPSSGEVSNLMFDRSTYALESPTRT